MKPTGIHVVASAKVGKLQMLEVDLLDEKGLRYKTKIVSSNELKDKGIIKRHPGFKKAEAWFNTEEGLRWVEEAVEVSL